MLPVEILLVIAEIDQESFVSIRSISRGVRDYTNKYMEKYKRRFSRWVETKNLQGYIKKYRRLPNGEKHGECEEYYENGKIREVSGYKDGKLDGLYVLYNSLGVPTIRCNYLNGEKNGFYQSMYNDGQVIEQCTFAGGKYQGLYQHWYKKNGDDDLRLRCECYYENNRLHGLYRAWYKNGTLKLRCQFLEGQTHSLHEMWYDDEKKMQRCYFKDGKYHGLYERWDEAGKLCVKCEYTNGEVTREFFV